MGEKGFVTRIRNCYAISFFRFVIPGSTRNLNQAEIGCLYSMIVTSWPEEKHWSARL